MSSPLTQREVDERALFLADFRQREGIPAGIPDEMVWASTRAATQFVGWQAGRATLDQSASPASELPYVEGWSLPRDLPTAHAEMRKLRIAYVDAMLTQQAAPEVPASEQHGQWVRCTPDLIKAGVSCAKTPRRPGDGSYSHDHFISHAATTATEIAPLDEKTSGGSDE